MGVSGQGDCMFIEALSASPELLLLGAATIVLAVSVIPLMAAGAAASALANLVPTGGGGQDLTSYADYTDVGGVSLHPADILSQFLIGMGTIGQYATERAEEEVRFSDSSRVQSLPYFSGGGLPFTIGATGMDVGYNPQPLKVHGNAPFGSYGESQGGSDDGGNGDDGGGDGEGPGDDRPDVRLQGSTTGVAADQLAQKQATVADPGPDPSQGDYQNMLSALRDMRGFA